MLDSSNFNSNSLSKTIETLFSLTKEEHNKQLLQQQLEKCYQEKENQESNILTNTTAVVVSVFIYLLLYTAQVDKISLSFIEIKDASVLLIHYPIFVLYLTLVLVMNDFHRVEVTNKYFLLFSILYPKVLLSDLPNMFTPLSQIELLLNGSHLKSAKYKLIQTVTFTVIFISIYCSGMIMFALTLYQVFIKEEGLNIINFFSIIIQVSIIFHLVSVLLQKVKLQNVYKGFLSNNTNV